MAAPRPRIRVPTREDFATLERESGLAVQLHFPSPPESTVAILVLLHGLGDSEGPFAGFARGMNLPGVLAISVRGPSPLPPAMLGLPLDSGPTSHFHWGDDIRLASGGAGDEGQLDPDPGFERAAGLVTDRLVRGVLVDTCGWDAEDVLLLGYGQGGSLALGLASRLRTATPRVTEAADEGEDKDKDSSNKKQTGTAFKGVVSIGGPLPQSMVPTIGGVPKSATPVLLCRGSESELLDDDAVDAARAEFARVEVADWARAQDGMPASREEMVHIMRFFADRLAEGAPQPPLPGAASFGG